MRIDERLDFLPDEYVQRKGRRRAFAVGTSLALTVAAVIGIGSFRAGAALRRAELSRGEIAHDYNEAAGHFEQLCNQRAAQGKLMQQAALAASLVETVPRSNILAELTNCLPAGATLIDLALDSRPHTQPTPSAFDLKKSALKVRQSPEPSPVEAMTSEVTVKITGLAGTDVEVARYLSQLSRSSLFQDVNLLISEASAAPGQKTSALRRFQIQMMLKANAQLPSRSVQDKTTTADTND